MPNENKTLEEVKEDISNVSGGFNWKFWKRKSEEDSTTNLLAQNPDSSPEKPEDTKTNTENRPGNRRRR